MGLFMVGMVKLGKKDIPKDYLLSSDYAERGGHKTLHRNIQGQRVICVGWNEPGKKAG